MEIRRYLHTAILVSDLQQAEHFYGTVLGLPKADRPLNFPGIWYQIGETQIHIIVADAFTQALHNSEKWGRNSHLALAVADLPAAQAELEQQGYHVQASASGRSALFVQDPDGNVVELSQL